jgi:hypothetical protein
MTSADLYELLYRDIYVTDWRMYSYVPDRSALSGEVVLQLRRSFRAEAYRGLSSRLDTQLYRSIQQQVDMRARRVAQHAREQS